MRCPTRQLPTLIKALHGLHGLALLVFTLVLGCSSGVGTEGKNDAGSFGSISQGSGDASGTEADTSSDPFCGDQVCDPLTESCDTCPADCDACTYCGDTICNGDENCMLCAQDCEVCPGCGDEVCDGQETCATCPQDCDEDCGAEVCGDDICNGFETCQNCEQDCDPCGPMCPDDDCNGAENCGTCEQDCGPCPGCPNDTCDNGETCVSCPADCEVCSCPCNPNAEPEFNNFCHYGPNTPGCPMTQPGGYCDPNADGGYGDADWNLGYFEYLAQCG